MKSLKRNNRNLRTIILVAIFKEAVKATRPKKSLIFYKNSPMLIPKSKLVNKVGNETDTDILIEQTNKLFYNIREKGKISIESNFESNNMDHGYGRMDTVRLEDGEEPFYVKIFEIGLRADSMVLIAFKSVLKVFEIREDDLQLRKVVKIEDFGRNSSKVFFKFCSILPDYDKLLIITRFENRTIDPHSIKKNFEVRLSYINFTDTGVNRGIMVNPFPIKIEKLLISVKSRANFSVCINQKVDLQMGKSAQDYSRIYTITSYCKVFKQKSFGKLDSLSSQMHLFFINSIENFTTTPVVSKKFRRITTYDKAQDNLSLTIPDYTLVQAVKITTFANHLIIFDIKGIMSIPNLGRPESDEKRLQIFFKRKVNFDYDKVKCDQLDQKELLCSLYNSTKRETRVKNYEIIQEGGQIYVIKDHKEITGFGLIRNIINYQRVIVAVYKRKPEQDYFELVLVDRRHKNIIGRYSLDQIRGGTVLGSKGINYRGTGFEIFQGNLVVIQTGAQAEGVKLNFTLFGVALPYFEFTPIVQDLAGSKCHEYINYCLGTELSFSRVDPASGKLSKLPDTRKAYLIDEGHFEGLLMIQEDTGKPGDEDSTKNLELDFRNILKIDINERFFGSVREAHLSKRLKIGKGNIKNLAEVTRRSVKKSRRDANDLNRYEDQFDVEISNDIFGDFELEEIGKIYIIACSENTITIFLEAVSWNKSLALLSLKEPMALSVTRREFKITKENSVLKIVDKEARKLFYKCYHSSIDTKRDATYLFYCAFRRAKDDMYIVFEIEYYLKDTRKIALDLLFRLITKYRLIELAYIRTNRDTKILFFVSENRVIIGDSFYINNEGEETEASYVEKLRVGLNELLPGKYRNAGFLISSFKLWTLNSLTILFTNPKSTEKLLIVYSYNRLAKSLKPIGLSYFQTKQLTVFLSRHSRMKMAVFAKGHDFIYSFDLERDIIYRENPPNGHHLEPVRLFENLGLNESFVFNQNEMDEISLVDQDDSFFVKIFDPSDEKIYSLIFKFSDYGLIELKRKYPFSIDFNKVEFFNFNDDEKSILADPFHIYARKWNPVQEESSRILFYFISSRNIFFVKDPHYHLENLNDDIERKQLGNTNGPYGEKNGTKNIGVLRVALTDMDGIEYEECYYYRYENLAAHGKREINRKESVKVNYFTYNFSIFEPDVTKLTLACPNYYKTSYRINKNGVKRIICDPILSLRGEGALARGEQWSFHKTEVSERIEDFHQMGNLGFGNLKDIAIYNDMVVVLREDTLVFYHYYSGIFQKIFSAKIKKKSLRVIESFSQCQKIVKLEDSEAPFQNIEIILFCSLSPSKTIIKKASKIMKVTASVAKAYIQRKIQKKNFEILELTCIREAEFRQYSHIAEFSPKTRFCKNLIFRMKSVDYGTRKSDFLDISIFTKNSLKSIYSSLKLKGDDTKKLISYTPISLGPWRPPIGSGLEDGSWTQWSGSSVIELLLVEQNELSLPLVSFVYLKFRFSNTRYYIYGLPKSVTLQIDLKVDEKILDVFYYHQEGGSVSVFVMYFGKFLELKAILPSKDREFSLEFIKGYSLKGLCKALSWYKMSVTRSKIALACSKSDYFEVETKVIFYNRNGPSQPIYVKNVIYGHSYDDFKMKIFENFDGQFWLILSDSLTVLASYKLDFDMRIQITKNITENENYFVSKKSVNIIAEDDFTSTKLELTFVGDIERMNRFHNFFKKNFIFLIIISVYLALACFMFNLDLIVEIFGFRFKEKVEKKTLWRHRKEFVELERRFLRDRDENMKWNMKKFE